MHQAIIILHCMYVELTVEAAWSADPSGRVLDPGATCPSQPPILSAWVGGSPTRGLYAAHDLPSDRLGAINFRVGQPVIAWYGRRIRMQLLGSRCRGCCPFVVTGCVRSTYSTVPCSRPLSGLSRSGRGAGGGWCSSRPTRHRPLRVCPSTPGTRGAPGDQFTVEG